MSDRGLSVTVSYTLNLAIATLLISGLLMAAGNTVETQREAAIDDQLEVIGMQLTANLMAADRLAESSTDDSTVRIDVNQPSHVSGSTYSISVNTGSDPSHARLETTSPRRTVTIPFPHSTTIENADVAGGDVTIVWDAGTDSIEVVPA